MEKHEDVYTLLVGGKRVPVSKKVYKSYYQCRDREKYLDKLANHNNLSLENCIEEGIPVEYQIASAEISMEEAVDEREFIEKMKKCLSMLDLSERRLIEDLFYLGKSEREVSAESGIPPMTIHDRKCRILKKLKKLMEK